MKRNWCKFEQEHFILDYFSIDWEDMVKIDEINLDNSTQLYLEKIDILINTYLLLVRTNKYKLKVKSNAWITLRLKKSISIKNKLLTKFIIKKDPRMKEEIHNRYKKSTFHTYEAK